MYAHDRNARSSIIYNRLYSYHHDLVLADNDGDTMTLYAKHQQHTLYLYISDEFRNDKLREDRK